MVLMTVCRLVPKYRIRRVKSLANDGQDSREKVKKKYRPNGIRLNECATAVCVSGVKERKKMRDEQKKVQRGKKDVGKQLFDKEGRYQSTFTNDSTWYQCQGTTSA